MWLANVTITLSCQLWLIAPKSGLQLPVLQGWNRLRTYDVHIQEVDEETLALVDYVGKCWASRLK